VRIRVLFAAVLLASSLSSFTFAQQRTRSSSSARAKSKTSSKTSRKTLRSRKPQKASPTRIRRIQRAFVASNDLKPMARQLLDLRSRAAFAGVDAYARKHADDDAGVLANLALGYAHVLDHDGRSAIPPLQRAEPGAGDLADYVTYFLGDSYQAAGQSEQAVATLRDFQTKYANSIFSREASIVYANALVATGNPQLAVTVLSRTRLPTRADVELALGQAQLKSGDTDKAADTLRHLYYSMPMSTEADRAGVLLRATPEGLGSTFALEKTRADALLQGRRYRDAAADYRELLSLASPADRPAVQVALAAALHKAGDDRQARIILEPMTATGETNAERLFYLLEIARSDRDDERFLQILGQLRQAGPNSSWLEQALLTVGNVFLLRNDYDRAIDFYREIRERFPQGQVAPYANWKVAWLSLRQNRVEDARKGFELQIAQYPTSAQVPAAIYWRARLAEENEKDPAKARAYYAKLADRFRNYYYADLARARLRGSGSPQSSADDPILAKVPALQVNAALRDVEPPADNLRLQKARLLQNGGLGDFALRELRAAASEGGSSWAIAEIARQYKDDGQYHRALQVLKAAVPSYYAMDIRALPRPYWEDLFPRPYWADLKRYSDANGLDPFLVASLIRQESEFNPGAISHANAWGLMQVLPSTGKTLARAEKVRGYRTESLLVPNVNLQLGTRYFRELVDHFNGRLEYALAAYNAGTDRVEGWLASGNFRDPQEFVESIPFTETREYVQAVLRNATMYRKLYGTP
jgi:soluble lytic murein transglycosylase